LISAQIDPLTDEQIRKRVVAVEDVDPGGLVQRHRVLGQTLFDMLFIRELINQSQHEAIHMFMDAMSRSGAVVRSANLDTEVFTPHKDVGNMMGERRMAFSSAYRTMVGDCGEDNSHIIMVCFDNLYVYPTCPESLARLASSIQPALESLVKHYGKYRIEDARVVIRNYRAPKRKRGKE
jgi:hypothetical protein